jgi:hypothetical protein
VPSGGERKTRNAATARWPVESRESLPQAVETALESNRGLSSFGLGLLGRLAKLISLIQFAQASSHFELSMADRCSAFETTCQPELPAIGATWRRDSHNVLLWNGVNATPEVRRNFFASH